MNKQMSEIIKIATDAISQLKETTVIPQVNIVMNMLAQINSQTLATTI